MSDKEKVSIDDMMEHLKRRERSERDSIPSEERREALRNGKIVTRADGSKAIKVKSRKRRTNQPKKEEEKSNTKRNIIVIGAFVVLLLIGGIAYTMLLAYYNGNSFRDKLVDSVEQVSGAEVELGSMQVSLTSAKASNVKLAWEDSALKSIKLENLYAEYGISAFIGGGWSGKEITASKALIKLEMLKDFDVSERGESTLDTDFQKIRSSKSAVRFGSSKTWSIDDAALSLENKGGSYHTLHLHGGTFKSAFREDLKISSGSVDFKQNSCDIVLRLGQEKGSGSIVLEGEAGYVEGSDVKMEMKLKSATLAPLLSTGMRRLFDGKVSSDIANLSIKVGADSIQQFTINVDSGEIQMKEFAFLKELKELMADTYYTSFKFSNSSGVIQSKDGIISFNELELEQEEKMSITGNLTVAADGSISGQLKVGVAYDVLADSPNAESLESIFTERVGGYAWADATLGGVLGRPSDDLALKLSALRGGTSTPAAPTPVPSPVEPREKTPQELIDELNQ